MTANTLPRWVSAFLVISTLLGILGYGIKGVGVLYAHNRFLTKDALRAAITENNALLTRTFQRTLSSILKTPPYLS